MVLEKPLENLRLLALALVGVSLISYGAAAQDATSGDADDPEIEEMDEGNPAWDDPGRLAEIISRDEEMEREALQRQLDNGDITEEEFDLSSAALDQEIADAEALIAELSAEQLHALNKFLNDTNNNGRGVFLDAEHLRLIIDEGYGDREIRLLTKALEEEYKFTRFANRARDRAEATGNDKFLEREQRFLDRADGQKNKFLDRIGDTTAEVTTEGSSRFSLTTDALSDARDEARDDARDEARDEARHAARDAARGAARDEARGQARAAARLAARDAVKEAVRAAVKDEVKNIARGKDK